MRLPISPTSTLRTVGLTLVACVASIGVGSSYAHADLPGVDMRTFRASTDPNAGLAIEPTTTPGHLLWNAGAWLNYANAPVVLYDARTGNAATRPVQHTLGLDLTLGLGLGKRAAVGANLPLLLFQDGSATPATVSTTGKLPATGIADIGLSGKVALVPNEQGGFGVAAHALVSLPTGDPSSYAGDGSVTTTAKIIGEYSLMIAAVQASVGYKVRTERHRFPDASAGGIVFGDELPFSLAISLKPGVLKIDRSNRQRWELGLRGWFPAGPVGPFGSGDPGSASLTPLLLGVSDRIELGRYRDAFALIGADIGLNSAVGVPTFRGMIAFGWAPREHDADHDGIPDDVDQCPMHPEDKDGFEDNDGCPEIDDDEDGIVDKEDACPRVKGIEQANPKLNGCPPPDDDRDSIPNDEDVCPQKAGPQNDDPSQNGCPNLDSDGDAIPDYRDACPNEAEDRDGYQDDDGCRDRDNDDDGILDEDDACPNEKGVPSTDSKVRGCPPPPASPAPAEPKAPVKGAATKPK